MTPLTPYEVSSLLDPLLPRPCANCHIHFTPKRANQKYCNVRCRKQSRIINQIVDIDIKRYCGWCEREIQSTNPKAIFCSSKCRKLAYEARELTPCWYCGAIANTEDHFLPTAFLYTIESLFGPQKNFVVPACSECNSTAGDRVFYTPKEKRLYIAERYRKRYKNLLIAPDWTEKEMEEVGFGLQSFVRTSEQMKFYMKKRIKRLERGSKR